MKTIHLFIKQQGKWKVLKNLYDNFLETDSTFHFVFWGNSKFKGYSFKGQHVLLRVDNEKVDIISDYLRGYVEFDVYDYPFPNRRTFKHRLGLGKRSPEYLYWKEFHQLYNIYSVLSIKTKGASRRDSELQILHLPLNIFGLSFNDEIDFYLDLISKKLKVKEAMEI